MWCVRGVLRMAVCRALCGVVGTRDVSECDWRRSAACEAWRAMCCVRSVLCRVRCGRRASWRRVHSPAAPRRVGALWSCVQCAACVVCCARCGAVGARAGSECEAAAGWGARCVAAAVAFRLVCARVMSRRRQCRGAVGCERKVRNVWRAGVPRAVRCGRRASWKRVRGGGGLGGSLRRGLRGVPGVCVCSRDEQTARNVSVR